MPVESGVTVPAGFPATLEAFLEERLPMFKAQPPDDWVDGVAHLYNTSTVAVQQAVTSQRRAAPVVHLQAEQSRVGAAPPVHGMSCPRGYDGLLDALRAAGHRLVRHRDPHGRDSIRTTCPAHHDRKPSLVVTRDENKALVRCFAGCKNPAIVAALGLKMADLFNGPRTPGTSRVVEATYDYRAIDGTLLGQKIRYKPKGFRWRLYSPAVGLYRLPDLIGNRTVFKTEGEKACDRLWAMGVAATCGPQGAGRWDEDWSRSLWMHGCRELIILMDNDKAGLDHAEQVAAITYSIPVDEPIGVKVLSLPRLPYGGDIVDWLTAGHDIEELAAIVAAAPLWTPQRLEQEREQHRKDLRRARNQRYRSKLRGIVRGPA